MANMHSVSALGFSLLNKFPHVTLKDLILNPGVGISIISDYRWDSWLKLDKVTILEVVE